MVPLAPVAFTAAGAFVFVAAPYGWAPPGMDVAVRTTDGGRTWYRQESGRGGLSVSYVNNNTATAARESSHPPHGNRRRVDAATDCSQRERVTPASPFPSTCGEGIPR